MAVYDARVGSTAVRWEDWGKEFRELAIVNFATYPLAATDTLKIMDIPAGVLVTAVRVKVITADTTGSSPTFDLYINSGTKFMASANPKSAAGTYLQNDGTVGTGAATVIYDNTAVGQLILLCNSAAIAVAKLQFEVKGYVNALPAANASVLAN